jgi:hypothetical protein
MLWWPTKGQFNAVIGYSPSFNCLPVGLICSTELYKCVLTDIVTDLLHRFRYVELIPLNTKTHFTLVPSVCSSKLIVINEFLLNFLINWKIGCVWSYRYGRCSPLGYSAMCDDNILNYFLQLVIRFIRLKFTPKSIKPHLSYAIRDLFKDSFVLRLEFFDWRVA